jgi:hypothetical protein
MKVVRLKSIRGLKFYVIIVNDAVVVDPVTYLFETSE